MRRPRGDSGSALILMPAAVLVVVVLGSITIDSTVAYLGRHELQAAATAAANDAVTFGIDPDAYRATGAYVLAPGRVDEAVHAAVRASHLVARNVTVSVSVGDRTVTVTLEGDVTTVFAPALPGAERTVHVVAQASATALEP